MPSILALFCSCILSFLPQQQDEFSLELRGPGPIQGEPVMLVLHTGAAVAVSGMAEWLGQKIALDSLDGALVGLAAVDRGQKPGPYPLRIAIRFADGAQGSFSQTITVQPKAFPSSNLSVDPKFTKLSKEDLAWIEDDNRAAGRAYASSSPTRLWNRMFAAPAEGPWSSGFGERRLFNGAEASYHSGADIAVPQGTPVCCSNDGRVVLVKSMFFGGNTILVDHGHGVFSGYMHLSEFKVKEGDAVLRGQVIGVSGATGRVTGAHLHWMLRINGIKVDARGLLAMGN